MTDRELMQQALDALEAMQSYAAAEKKGLRICDEAIEALRAQLTQAEQELVAWSRVNMHNHKEGDLGIGTKPYAAQAAMVAGQTQGRMYVDPVTGDAGIGTVKWDASSPLVVHPHPAFQTTEPQREWQTLTDEEIDQAAWPYFIGNIMPSVKLIVRKLEAKLREKNHG